MVILFLHAHAPNENNNSLHDPNMPNLPASLKAGPRVEAKPPASCFIICAQADSNMIRRIRMPTDP